MKRIILFIIIVVFALPLFSRGYDEIVKSKKIVIGMDLGYIPFEFRGGKRLRPMGFDIDLIKYMCRDFKVNPQVVEYKFYNLFTKLKEGKIDIAISAITKTPQREKEVDFSIPYFKSGQGLLLKKNVNISSISDIDKEGFTIGVVKGTTGAKYAKENFKKAKLIEFDNENLAVFSVKKGISKAVIYDLPYLKLFAIYAKDFAYVYEKPLTTESYAIAVKKGNDKLLAKINAFISSFLGSQEYKSMVRKWTVDIAKEIFK